MAKRVLIGLTILIVLTLTACGSFTIQGEMVSPAEATTQKVESEMIVGDATPTSTESDQLRDASDPTGKPTSTDEPTSSPTSTSTPLPTPILTSTPMVVEPTQTESKDYVLNVQLRSASPVSFGNSSKIKIELWAYDRLIADAPATNLLTEIAPISSLDQSFTIAFDTEDFEKVTPQSGHEDAFGYYFTFYIDMNNDGQICPGEDYGQDYEKTDKMFFDESDIGMRNVEVSIRNVAIDGCRPF
jgi:hypothetical protein